jgi:hypothetical protein
VKNKIRENFKAMDEKFPTIPCTRECCDIPDNIVDHGDLRYTCVRHEWCHTCDGVARPEDPCPCIVISEEQQHVCGFSHIVVGVNYSAQDFSDDPSSAKRIDDDCGGMRGSVFEHGLAATACGSIQQGRSGQSGDRKDDAAPAPRSLKAVAAAARAKADADWFSRMVQGTRRVLLGMTDRDARDRIAREHDARALAEYRTAEGKYARAAHRAGARRSRIVREIHAERLDRKHRRSVPEVGPRAVARWCANVVALWRLLVHTLPSETAERGSAPDSCTAFIIGSIYGLADGIAHGKTGIVVVPPDPELAAALPPPQDLAELGVQQRSRSSGQKLLNKLINDFVIKSGSPEKARDDIATKLNSETQ